MTLNTAAVLPIDADDDAIRAALEQAVIPPLLAALAHATGDLSLLRDDLRPDPLMLAADAQGGITAAKQAEARELAFQAITGLRDGRVQLAPRPHEADLVKMMEFAVGTAEMEEYVALLEEELGVHDVDPRAPSWHKDTLAPDRRFEVAIIGAGMSGLLAAYRLRQAGVPFVVIEKNEDVGGTWFENTYPGCRVDNPNHLYSYSFAQKHDWPHHFSTQSALQAYFAECADAFDLRPNIRFGTEVVTASYDDATHRWSLALRDADGREETVEADAVISAVGQLNRPNFPDIKGLGTFDGPAFHSAEWDHAVDLTGKRVAVIGTGASATQLIPVVAEQAGHLVVFQRTPNWLAPTPEYHDEVPHGLQWLYTHVPYYSEWHRFSIFWRMGDGALRVVRVDPAWEPKDRSVNAESEFARMMLTAYLQEQFADAPELLPHVIPDYPVAAKRILRDNGVWAGALKRGNVRLVTERIREITASGITTDDGEHHDVDVIVYGTGFQASRFLTPMQVRGRAGVDLHEQWGANARAYLGITVPGFPNFFCLYGPNTNLVINGSIIYNSECEVRYVIDCVRLLLEGGHRALDCRKDVHDEYNERVDRENAAMAWGASSVNSWYKNEEGRITQNWPFTLLEFWQRTKQVDPADYELF